MTVLILKVVADSTDNPPIETAQITITEINGNPIADTTVGTLDIKTVELDPGPPPIIEIMGTEKDIQTLTNVRGDAVFYYPADTLINQLTLNTSKAGFTPDTRNVNLHAGQRIFEEIRLSAI